MTLLAEKRKKRSFNTQPPEGGCNWNGIELISDNKVSTHSRPKAAAVNSVIPTSFVFGFQHTAARRRLPPTIGTMPPLLGFQHTAARRRLQSKASKIKSKSWFQHTAARRRLPTKPLGVATLKMFQHTAARRRLHRLNFKQSIHDLVSTHSRAEAAAPYIKK